MILRQPITVSAIIISALIMLSCSGGNAIQPVSDPPTTPSLEADAATHDTNSGRCLWGYYLIEYHPVDNTADVIPVRLTTKHWNVLGWLETGPCTTCVSIVGVSDSGHGTTLFDVRLTHPFPHPNLTGFDVRGIAMFEGSFTFTFADLVTPDRTLGDGEVINADGYTTLYESATAGSGPGGLEGYIEGRFATPTAPNSELNAFKRYVSTDVANTRNAFYAGEAIDVTYDIDMPDSDFIFGYAVDASWASPTTKPVTDPMTDFPPETNCPEPWQIVITETPIGQGLTNQGGSTILTVDVYDYQGSASHKTPTIEITGFGCPPVDIPWLEDGPDYTRYEIIYTAFDMDPGDYKCLVLVEDNENDTAPAWLDLTAYQQHTIHVTEYQHSGWAITWGGTEWDGGGLDVAADYYGNAYVVGLFQDVVDFDPSGEVFEATSNGDRDAYLVKYDTNGDLVWLRTWGGLDSDTCYSVAVAYDGSVFVTGSFQDTVDFDPGPDIFELVSAGNSDIFVSRFDTDGNFVWASGWGVTENDYGNVITVDDASAYFYVGGASNYDMCLTCLDQSSGAVEWSHTWGGTEYDTCSGIALDMDGNIIVGGGYGDTVDFDPDPVETESHTANGGSDAWLSSFDPTGDLRWVRTWGGTGLDDVLDVDSHGVHTVLVVGRFSDTVDFNTGPGDPEIRISAGWNDAFMCRYDPEGDFQWVQAWGGPGGYGEWEYADGVSIDNNLNIYVTGRFGATVDFDPGAGVEELTANGQVDVYLAGFNFVGDLQWVRGWGGLFEDTGSAVSASAFGDVFVTGGFWDTVDFDPGTGVQNETSNGQVDVFVSKFNPDGEW